MTTETLLLAPGVRSPGRKDRFPGLIPILLGYALWAVWAVYTRPIAALQADARAGAAASVDTRFMALISLVGLVCVLVFSIVVGAYVLTIRSMRRGDQACGCRVAPDRPVR